MSKHTKGPWESHGTIVYLPNTRGGFSIASCPDAEANARLIAAAPDLLEALEDLLPLLEDRRLQDTARAAIAKATGGEV